MHDPDISEFDRLKQEYAEETFEVTTPMTPSEVRHLIATRRYMEERIGTNGSIQLTIEISDSVKGLMTALADHQEKRNKEKLAALEDEEDLEDEDADEEEID